MKKGAQNLKLNRKLPADKLFQHTLAWPASFGTEFIFHSCRPHFVKIVSSTHFVSAELLSFFRRPCWFLFVVFCTFIAILLWCLGSAGEVDKCPASESQFRPCLATVKQLEGDAERRNQLVMQMTCSSGSEETDLQLLAETTRSWTRVGWRPIWAEGPRKRVDCLKALPPGTVFKDQDDWWLFSQWSQWFLRCTEACGPSPHWYFLCHGKVLSQCEEAGIDSKLRCKTYNLTSAYRHVPVRPSHYRYAFVSVYNCKRGHAEIYRMRTMPSRVTHSVFGFLRLSRCLYSLAVRGLHLLTTGFCDDFILASKPALCKSSKNSMELLFMLTGWLYAKEGKKSTAFSSRCKALGVEFDFSRSEQRLLAVANTATRKEELIAQITAALELGTLDKQECLMLRGKLGFADSFLHGRVGKPVLKKLIDHVCGKSSRIDSELKAALMAMKVGLQHAGPKIVSSQSFSQWFIYTDASYEPADGTGGLGGVLVNAET